MSKYSVGTVVRVYFLAISLNYLRFLGDAYGSIDAPEGNKKQVSSNIWGREVPIQNGIPRKTLFVSFELMF